MKGKIEVRHGVGTKIIPLISLILVVASIITCVIGVFGIGGVNNKAEREREEFLAKPYIEKTIEAVHTIDINFVNYSSIESITHLKQSTYFCAVFVSNSNEIKKYFDLTTKEEISEQIWNDKVSKTLSYLLYVGESGKNVAVTIDGEDLVKVIREARGEEWL